MLDLCDRTMTDTYFSVNEKVTGNSWDPPDPDPPFAIHGNYLISDNRYKSMGVVAGGSATHRNTYSEVRKYHQRITANKTHNPPQLHPRYVSY